MIWIALAVIVWPDTVKIGAFTHMTDVMSPEVLSLICLVTGIVGTVALATNGVSRVAGPVTRAVCALVRSFVWGQFTYALWLFGGTQGVPSLGLGFWLLFTASEIYVAYRAMMDAAIGSRVL